MDRPVCYVSPVKGNAKAMLGAFAEGSGAELVPGDKYQPGRPAVFWGVDRATLAVWYEVERTRTPYWYVDNGYFRSKWQGGDYYRITYMDEQHSGAGDSDGKRFDALQLEIKPWRTEQAGRVMLACQSDFWHERHGHGPAANWAEGCMRAMRPHTHRTMVVRRKPLGGIKEPPLQDEWPATWCVVTHSSMVAAEALLAGVPAFVTAPSSCFGWVCSSNLSEIEHPARGDRRAWANVLADNQWTLNEIRSGVAWRSLQERTALGYWHDQQGETA